VQQALATIIPVEGYREHQDVNPRERLKEEWCVMDAANVCAVVPLTSEAEQVLRPWWSHASKAPSRDATEKVADPPVSKLVSTRYSLEYVQKIVTAAHLMDESASFEMGKNTPIAIKTEHFALWLAPRIE
jgi:hypothetical protein